MGNLLHFLLYLCQFLLALSCSLLCFLDHLGFCILHELGVCQAALQPLQIFF